MQTLLEAQDYKAMFNDVFRLCQDDDEGSRENERSYCENIIDANLKWAKQVLKKSDRIVWWLRYIKAQLLDFVDDEHQGAGGHWLAQFDPNSVNAGTGGGGYHYGEFNLNGRPKLYLEHFMSLDSDKIQAFVFGKQPNAEVFAALRRLEEEWLDAGARHIPQDHENNAEADILISYNGGKMVWMDLNRDSCRFEGRAMRHCGNVPREGSGDTVISLRSHVRKGSRDYWEPHLTFTRDEHHYLQERKARGNSKPPPQYHDKIVDLLLLKNKDVYPHLDDDWDNDGAGDEYYIAGIGSGIWSHEEDFKIDDLEPALREKLLRARPDLGTAMEYAEYSEHVDWEEFARKLRGGHAMSLYRTQGNEFTIVINLPTPFSAVVSENGCAETLVFEALSSVRDQPTYIELEGRIKKAAKRLRASAIKVLAPLTQALETKFKVFDLERTAVHSEQRQLHLEIMGDLNILDECFKTRNEAFHALAKFADPTFRQEIQTTAFKALMKLKDKFEAEALLAALNA